MSQRSLSTTEEFTPNTHLNLENAIIESLHNSTTESILSWPYFEAFSSIRQNYVSIFQLEQSRPGLTLGAEPTYPILSEDRLDAVLDSFQETVNFWYPTMSMSRLGHERQLISQGNTEDTSGVDLCSARLVMALGCAGQVVRGAFYREDVTASREELEFKQAERALAEQYFGGALELMHHVNSEMSCSAVQCLFFTA
jgi:hypothetical protein